MELAAGDGTGREGGWEGGREGGFAGELENGKRGFGCGAKRRALPMPRTAQEMASELHAW